MLIRKKEGNPGHWSARTRVGKGGPSPSPAARARGRREGREDSRIDRGGVEDQVYLASARVRRSPSTSRRDSDRTSATHRSSRAPCARIPASRKSLATRRAASGAPDAGWPSLPASL